MALEPSLTCFDHRKRAWLRAVQRLGASLADAEPQVHGIEYNLIVVVGTLTTTV